VMLWRSVVACETLGRHPLHADYLCISIRSTARQSCSESEWKHARGWPRQQGPWRRMSTKQFWKARSWTFLISSRLGQLAIMITLMPLMHAQSYTEKILCSFTGISQSPIYPYAGLVMDRAGNLYGTTNGGGAGWGTIFQLSPNSDGSWTESTLFKELLGCERCSLAQWVSVGRLPLTGSRAGQRSPSSPRSSRVTSPACFVPAPQ
jgi:hypothetical protein